MVIVTLESEPYVDGIEALRNRTVGVVESYASHELLAKNHPYLELHLSKNVRKGLEAVSNGQTYAFVGNLAVASQVIREAGITNLKVSGQTPYRFELRMAVRKDWPELIPILQKGLDSIRPEERDQIYNRWIRVKFQQEVDYGFVFEMLGVAVLIMLIIFIWNRRLKNEIIHRQKAEELLQSNKEELEAIVIELNASKKDIEQQADQLAELVEKESAFNDRLNYEADVKDRFFSIISHDLKSPFNSLLGMTQMMSHLADKFSKDQLVEYATNVNEAGERVFALLQNLLEWSRLQMEGTKLDPEMLPLRELAQECIDISKPVSLEKEIKVTNKIKNATAFADRDMVQTVIRNLIANSLKFTRSNGSIEISSQDLGDSVQVTVSDTGVGMSQEHAEKVFDLDQKTSTKGTSGEYGTGLGLPLCKDMLERSGGSIWVESTPGAGSRFHFSLPVEAEEEMISCHNNVAPATGYIPRR